MIFWNLIGLSQYISIFGLSKYVLIRLLGYPAAFPGDHAWSCYYYFAGIGALAGKARCALGGLSSGSHIWTAAIFFLFWGWTDVESSGKIGKHRRPHLFFFRKTMLIQGSKAAIGHADSWQDPRDLSWHRHRGCRCPSAWSSGHSLAWLKLLVTVRNYMKLYY